MDRVIAMVTTPSLLENADLTLSQLRVLKSQAEEQQYKALLTSVYRSLFIVHCLLFIVYCSLFIVHCSLISKRLIIFLAIFSPIAYLSSSAV